MPRNDDEAQAEYFIDLGRATILAADAIRALPPAFRALLEQMSAQNGSLKHQPPHSRLTSGARKPPVPHRRAGVVEKI